MNYKYLFGPIPSRRLGMSLGVDLIPGKTCTLDCVYCECGRTTVPTRERREYVPRAALLRELDTFLADEPKLDFVTLYGAGEPTLHSGIGKVITHLKNNYPGYRIALLTNGTLFSDPSVRREVVQADVILPSLDAVSPACFAKINRPVPGIIPGRVVEGLAALRREYAGEIWLEIFIVPGCNDSDEELAALTGVVAKIDPDRIQLNSLDRPAAEKWVTPASGDCLGRLKERFGPAAEVIAKISVAEYPGTITGDITRAIMDALQRRPCTAADLAEMTGVPPAEIESIVRVLLREKKITPTEEARGTFYTKA